MTEQQPQPDEQGTRAEYVRADMSKAPTSEAGQRAAAEGMATAQGWTGPELSKAVREHNGRVLARTGVDIHQGEAATLREKLLALLAEHDETADRHRAQEEAAYGIRAFAERYAKAESFEERDDLAEQYGSSLTLPEAGLIRRVAKALESGLPGVIVDAHVDGMSARAIARELSCSDRHAYQVIKDYPWEAVWILYRATGDDEWEQVDAGLVETTETADDLANQLMGRHLTDDLARTGARVSVWRAGDGNDPDEARGECQIEGNSTTD
ncbi:hypothetical protein [Streptomyces sp. 3211]|uniref:hypothetical protein n=1 Tax=Streptomyces sp. 3211 TaxID=1964449 RepID=UPI0009A4C4EA|nr:hypothetical protein [Streptomyces sp. 3211]